MDFNYTEILQYIEYRLNLLLHKNKHEIDPLEILSESYIKWNDDNSKSLKQHINIWVLEHIRSKIVLQTNGDRVCVKCKETKNINEFGQTFLKRFNKYITCSYCKECNRKNVKEWANNNREIYNERVKKHKIKGRKNLDDWYIIQILQRKYTKEYIANNYYLVQEKRDKILEKRQKSKVSKHRTNKLTQC